MPPTITLQAPALEDFTHHAQRDALHRALTTIRSALPSTFGRAWVLRVGVSPLERCPDDHTTLVLRVWVLCAPETLFGLRGWRDALDGVWHDPRSDLRILWSVWEISKALRFSTRQSFEALSMMASAPLLLPHTPQRAWSDALQDLLPGALHRGSVATLRALAQSMLSDTAPPNPHTQSATQQLTLSAHLLAANKTLCLYHPPDTRRHLWTHAFSSSTTAAQILSKPFSTDLLPQSPPLYDDLHTFLIRLRHASTRW